MNTRVLGDRFLRLKEVFNQANDLVLEMVNLIMIVALFGVFCLIAKIFATTEIRGFYSYIKICLKELSYKAQEYEIEYNNTKRKIKAYAIVFANTSQYGNDARIAPNAKIDDGLIDFVIINKFPSWQIPYFLYKVLKGKVLQNKNVEIILSKEMKISSIKPFAHLDGEIKYFTNPLNVKISDKKLKILVPNE